MSKRADFTEDQINDIRCIYRKHIHHKGLADLYSVRNIAAKYGVYPNTIYDIINGLSYKKYPEKYCADKE